jgi:hypothetical protein
MRTVYDCAVQHMKKGGSTMAGAGCFAARVLPLTGKLTNMLNAKSRA